MKPRFRPKFNIRKGDSVVVIAGDDKNLKKPCKVLAVYPLKARVLVEGVHIIKKHMKPNAQNTQGKIVSKEAPIHISNVMLWDEKQKSPTKIKRVRENNTFKRISKKSGETL